VSHARIPVAEDTIGNTRVPIKVSVGAKGLGNKSKRGAVLELRGKEFCCTGVRVAVVKGTDC
jgi:hypothetical protein